MAVLQTVLAPFQAVLAPFQAVNGLLGHVGRWAAIVALAIMVFVILLQVFCRYVLGTALPWPDEAARFLMLWMTGLAAPVAYRRGGFVAIDMLERAIPRSAAALLMLFLQIVALAVLLTAIQYGWKHVNSGWLFASSSLRVPLDLIGGTSAKVKLAWMYLSLWVGMVLLTLVNVELILRSLITLAGGQVMPLAAPGLPEAE